MASETAVQQHDKCGSFPTNKTYNKKSIENEMMKYFTLWENINLQQSIVVSTFNYTETASQIITLYSQPIYEPLA